ncbi:MAG: hypothetical protein IT529_06620 [Burkholderiales bacterium]|nr:hypothetical protein [Burkholderiales bacterium]
MRRVPGFAPAGAPDSIARGTGHSWANRSDMPCHMLFVLIDGEFDTELKVAFAQEQSAADERG